MPPTLCLADITVSLLKAAFGELTDGKSCHEKRIWGEKGGYDYSDDDDNDDDGEKGYGGKKGGKYDYYCDDDDDDGGKVY